MSSEPRDDDRAIHDAIERLPRQALLQLTGRWQRRLITHLAEVLQLAGVDELAMLLSDSSIALAVIDDVRARLHEHERWRTAKPDDAHRLRSALNALFLARRAALVSAVTDDRLDDRRMRDAARELAALCVNVARYRDICVDPSLAPPRRGPQINAELNQQLSEVLGTETTV